ncbi:MAG TPA: hypothetical protein V6C72_19545, partial [Chroococcales cyanobacterium]
GKELRDLDFTAIEHDIDQIAFDKALCMPPTLAYLLRAGTTVEGIARTLKPNFSFVDAAKGPLKKWVLSRPSSAAQLLRVFFNGNLNLNEETVLRLVSGKSGQSGQADGARGKGKNGKHSDTMENLERARQDEEHLKEIETLKAKVYLLETQAQKRSELGSHLIFLALWLLAFAIVFATLAFIPEYRPYANIFLIGNAVIGAIIMWHLVLPDSLARVLKRSVQSRGQRR